MSKLTDSYNVQDAETKYFGVKGASAGVATLAAPSAFGASYSLELPADDGTPGQVLATDGADTTYWRNFTGGTTTFADTTFDIYKAGDPYAQSKFYCASIATGQTRTITMPDANVDLAFVPSQSVETSSTPQFAKVGIAQAAGTEQLEVNGTAKATTSVIVGASTPSLTQWGYLAAQDQSLVQASDVQFANVTASATLKLKDATTGTINIIAPTSISTPYSLTLPPDMGTNVYVLRTDGTGVLTWVPAAGGSGGGSFSEAFFDLYKAADMTAKAVFSVGSSAGQVRTIAMPDSNVNLANLPAQLTNTTSSPQFAKLGVAQAAGSNQVNVNGTAKSTSGVIVGASSTTSTQWGYLAGMNQTLIAGSNVSFSKFGTSAGTVAAPTLRMTDSGTGFYRIGANNIGFAVSGANALDIKAGAIGVTNLKVLDGSVSAPSIAYVSDLNTGIYRVGTDDIGVACGGTKVAEIAATSTVNDVTFLNNDTTIYTYPTTTDTLRHEFLTWYASPYVISPSYSDCRGLVWSSAKHMFVMTLDDTYTLYSYDGINWSSSSSGTSNSWKNVAYGGGYFVTGGHYYNSGQNAKYSSDGINWYTSTINANTNVMWIFYGNGWFIALTNTMTSLWRSGDGGSSWASVSTPTFSILTTGCYAPALNMWCAAGGTAPGGYWTIITSTDTSNWYGRYSYSDSSFSAQDIEWSPDLGMFVAISSSSNSILTSTNGTSWTTRSMGGSSYTTERIIWNSDLKKFIVGGNTGSSPYQSMIGYSSDGITWNSVYVSMAYPYGRYIAYSPELKRHVFASASGSKNILFNNVADIIPLSRQISTAFCDWTDSTSVGFGSYAWRGMCCNKDGTFIVCDYTNARMAYSTNGLDWISVAVPVANNWVSVCYSPKNNLLCAVSLGGGSDRVITSSNGGTSWISRTPAQNNSWYGVCWSPELSIFCAISGDGTNRCMTSSDGITWQTQSLTSGSWYSICWSSKLKLFCAVGNNGYATSSTGVSWSTGSWPTSSDFRSVCWAPELGLFFATSYYGYSATSSNGSSWTLTKLTSYLNSVTWVSDYRFFVICGSNTIWISYDGLSLITVYKNMITSSASLYACEYSKQNKRIAVLTYSTPYLAVTLALPKTNNFMTPY